MFLLTVCIINLCQFTTSLHIPDLNIKSDIGITDDHSNHGLLNSAIINNWSQSLNIGSIALVATLLVILLGLVGFLRLSDRMRQTETQVKKLILQVKKLQNAQDS